MHLHPFCIGQGIPQFKQRDVWVLHHQFFEEGSMWCQFASIAGATLRRRSHVPLGPDLSPPASPGCWR